MTFSHRSANSSSWRAGASLAFAPRPRALRLAAAASRRASVTERSSSSPVSWVSLSTSPFASPERQRIVRAIERSFRPIGRERSRTRARFSPTSRDTLRPSRTNDPNTMPRKPRVGRMLDVRLDHRRIDPHRPRAEPPLPRRGHDQRWGISATVSAPSRRVISRTVDSSGTRSVSEIRQNRRR